MRTVLRADGNFARNTLVPCARALPLGCDRFRRVPVPLAGRLSLELSANVSGGVDRATARCRRNLALSLLYQLGRLVGIELGSPIDRS